MSDALGVRADGLRLLAVLLFLLVLVQQQFVKRVRLD
jgi:hypothetical protein